MIVFLFTVSVELRRPTRLMTDILYCCIDAFLKPIAFMITRHAKRAPVVGTEAHTTQTSPKSYPLWSSL